MQTLPTLRRPTLPTLDPWRARRAEEERARAEEAAAVAAIAGSVSRLGAGQDEQPAAAPPNTPAPPDPASGDARPALGRLPVINPALGRSVSPLTDADERGAEGRQIEAQGSAPALPTMRLDLASTSGPVVQPAERRDLGPMPLQRNAKGETVTRPEYDDTGDERTDLANYERSLQMFRNPQDRDGRKWSSLKRAALGALQGFAQTGSLAGAAGGAISGGVYGAAVPNWNERAERDTEQGQVGARLKAVDDYTKRGLELEGDREANRLKHEQADYYAARPEADAAKRRAAELKEERARIFRVLGSLKGQNLNPADPRVRQLQADADRASIPFDVESFNNSKGNLIRYTKTDPEHPERTVQVERNVATDEESVLGQKGYQATRNAEGMTTAEVKTDADRDRAYAGLEHERAVSNDLRRQGLQISQGHLTLAGQHFNLAQAQFDNRLSEETRKELKSANDLAAESERWQEAANAIGSRTSYVDPNDGKTKESRKAANQRDIFTARAESLRRRVLANYGYLFAPDGDGGTPKMSAAQLQQLFPSVGGNWSGLATRLGVTLTDEGSMQGPVQPSTLPHRGAPAAGRGAGAAPGRYAGQRMPRANLPAAAKALGMTEPAAERYITQQGGVIY